ncbi:hypothetical protein jhhlp_004075 [Lomentospora prolificans]|uniref:SH3 domain-containing protein n=1 Tax=Lomentospora prolificans TaxID=41688 RepID=A0A2N3NAJ6_9PEZI|nr:hypothetical protein jhhlp_004075 [Lomentospora prolificans]
MVSMDRQAIIESNRSIRNIKNELENLVEKGLIEDNAYETIMNLLPAESPLHGGGAVARNQSATPITSEKTTPPANNQAVTQAAPPPAYHQTGPPSLPIRNQAPPPPAPAKPVLAHARALYRYDGQDARDVNFDKDDQIAIHEYMNADWWMGRNLRTGQEGIFPKNYVMIEEPEKPGAPGPSAPMNPYNAHVPPMAVAEGGQGEHKDPGPSKLEQGGKKFGKKLGNAAIFGAGATIGSNIVNSIF